jgi:hypothetical protein
LRTSDVVTLARLLPIVTLARLLPIGTPLTIE